MRAAFLIDQQCQYPWEVGRNAEFGLHYGTFLQDAQVICMPIHVGRCCSVTAILNLVCMSELPGKLFKPQWLGHIPIYSDFIRITCIYLKTVFPGSFLRPTESVLQEWTSGICHFKAQSQWFPYIAKHIRIRGLEDGNRWIPLQKIPFIYGDYLNQHIKYEILPHIYIHIYMYKWYLITFQLYN